MLLKFEGSKRRGKKENIMNDENGQITLNFYYRQDKNVF